MMKKLVLLLAAALLLAGCAREELPVETTNPAWTPEGLYEENSTIEEESGGALRSYLTGENTGCGILPIGRDLLLIRTEQEETIRTNVTRVTGERLLTVTQTTLEGYYPIHFWQVRSDGSGVACYNEETKTFLLFDHNLHGSDGVKVPEDCTGNALLSPDFTKLYYATDTGIKELDRTQGIIRPVREGVSDTRVLLGLEMGGTVLRYYQQSDDRYLVVDTKTGQDIEEDWRDSTWLTTAKGYFVHRVVGVDEYIFGTAETEPQQLALPEGAKVLDVLPDEGKVLALEQGNLCLYDTASGLKTAAITLPDGFDAGDAKLTEAGAFVWVLAEDGRTLLRWETEKTKAEDPIIYVTPHYTAEAPDKEGFKACREQASQVKKLAGIDIFLGEDTEIMKSHLYTFQSDYHPQIYSKSLTLLEEALGKLPEGFVKKVERKDSGTTLTIALLYQVLDGEGNVVEMPQGHIGNYRSYLVLPYGGKLETVFFRQLYEAADLGIRKNGEDFASWSSLNPEGFLYAEQEGMPDSALWTGSDRAFLNEAATLSDVEERTQIFLAACGEKNVFDTPALQAKYAELCRVLRENFELPEDDVLWEQYLPPQPEEPTTEETTTEE